MDTDEKKDEPWYEPDCECQCGDSGVEPEWAWSYDESCFICQGCNERC